MNNKNSIIKKTIYLHYTNKKISKRYSINLKRSRINMKWITYYKEVFLKLNDTL